MKTTEQQRFRAKIAPANPAGCELWTAGTSNGYGRFWTGRLVVYAHRFAWEQANGLIPDGLQALHRCDVRACVTPSHMFLGTIAANMADRDAKGRVAHGSKHWNAKLNEARAVEVFLATGTQAAIAARHGICQTLVGYIKRRKIWTHATAGLTA